MNVTRIACLLGVVGVLLGGCPTTPVDGFKPGLYSGSMQTEMTVVVSGGYVMGDPDRLEVNATLRDACQGYTESDGETRGFLLAAEADRLDGYTHAEQVDTVFSSSCNTINPTFNIACFSCLLAVLDQVHSIENTPPETETATGPYNDTLLVLDDGTPDIDEDSVQVGFMVIRMTSYDLSLAPGAAVLDYTVEIDFIDTTDGFVLGTLIGVGTDTYTEISDTQISVVSQGSAGYSDIVGAFSISFQAEGTLTR